jgi:hypothetical protein
MRSPMTQKGCVAPMVTLPERDRSTVSIGLSFDSWGDSEPDRTALATPASFAERDQVLTAPDRRLDRVF